MSRFDPYGPVRPQRTVSLEVARTLQDQAQSALREVERLRAGLAAARAEQAELHARLRAAEVAATEPTPEPAADEGRAARLSADLANVRRHRDDDVERARRQGLAEGLAALADGIDDVRRALDVAPSDGPWADGLRRLHERLRGRLAAAGATELGAVGEAFDPARHEAIGVLPGPAGTIVAVARTGLTAADGMLLRPAAVAVGDGGMPVA